MAPAMTADVARQGVAQGGVPAQRHQLQCGADLALRRHSQEGRLRQIDLQRLAEHMAEDRLAGEVLEISQNDSGLIRRQARRPFMHNPGADRRRSQQRRRAQHDRDPWSALSSRRGWRRLDAPGRGGDGRLDPDLGGETIAASRGGDDQPIAPGSVGQRLSQCEDRLAQIGFIGDAAGPERVQHFVLGHHPARVFDKIEQGFQHAGRQGDRLAPPGQNAARRVQAVGSELKGRSRRRSDIHG